MPEPIRIVIADDNADFLNLLAAFLSHVDSIDVIGAAHNGQQAVEMIKAAAPAVVLQDIIMPQIDGFGVLEEINKLAPERRPQTILISAFGQERLTQIAMDLGADFFVMKPFDFHELATRIRQLYRLRQFMEGNVAELVHDNVKFQICDLLNQIGVPRHLKGYDYIEYAVEILSSDLTALRNIKEKIYARISVKYNTTSARVERNVRNAIEQAFLKGDLDLIYDIFGSCLNWEKLKPSNSEFFILFLNEMQKRLS
jgi:two-component system response regulator (stage 0 sporulation protein A)